MMRPIALAALAWLAVSPVAIADTPARTPVEARRPSVLSPEAKAGVQRILGARSIVGRRDPRIVEISAALHEARALAARASLDAAQADSTAFADSAKRIRAAMDALPEAPSGHRAASSLEELDSRCRAVLARLDAASSALDAAARGREAAALLSTLDLQAAPARSGQPVGPTYRLYQRPERLP